MAEKCDFIVSNTIEINDALGEVIRNDLHALEVLEECGTIFELMFDDLEASRDYMFRLIVEPVSLAAFAFAASVDRLHAWQSSYQHRPRPDVHQSPCLDVLGHWLVAYAYPYQGCHVVVTVLYFQDNKES